MHDILFKAHYHIVTKSLMESYITTARYKVSAQEVRKLSFCIKTKMEAFSCCLTASGCFTDFCS